MVASERITGVRNQIAGYQGQVGTQLVCHIDHASGLAHAEVRADMQVADLRDAQTLRIGMKPGNRQFDFTDLVVSYAFDNPTYPTTAAGAAMAATPAAALSIRRRLAEYRPANAAQARGISRK